MNDFVLFYFIFDFIRHYFQKKGLKAINPTKLFQFK